MSGSETFRPGDALQRLLDHAARRPKMTKAELLADASRCDEAYINTATERDMAEAYYQTLEAHLRAHGCDHDFAEVANGDV